VTIAQDDSSVDALLDRLSGLPLALTQAAAYIGQTAISIVQYLEYYDSMWKDLMEHQDEYPLQEYAERSVLTTWRLSYDQVKRQSEEAGNLLQLWSFLYAGDLWYELIACTERFSAESIVPDWLKSLTRNRLRFDRALALLIRFSMIEGKSQTASYAMHSVLHSWCRYLGETEAERTSFRELAVEIVGYTVPFEGVKEYWVLQRRLLPHAEAVFTGMKWTTKTEIKLIKARAYELIAILFRAHDRYAGAEELYDQLLVVKEKALGPEHNATLMTIHNLGNLYYSQGRLVEAERMYERTILGQQKALGPEHMDTLDAIHSLAMLYDRQGKFAKAEKMYEQVLRKREKVLGREHMETLKSINSLGSAYLNQGRLAEAEAMLRRALSGFEKALGPENMWTLSIVRGLGILYHEQHKPAKAEEMYERALAGLEKALGPEHIDTLTAVRSLGVFYCDRCRLEKAEEMYVRVLAGMEKALGPEHMDTLDTVSRLGYMYAKQDKLAKAEGMYERALAGYEKAFGPEHEDTLDTAWNLSIVYVDQGRLAEAEKMKSRAFGKEKALEPEHMSTSSSC